MAIAPQRQVAEFLDFGVVVLDIIFDGKTGGIEDADVAAEAE
jgi:hypothetical protein